MAVVPLMIFCIFFTFSTAAVNPIREHPHSVLATEGSWANFSCGIKLPGAIKWRIGDFTKDGYTQYNSGFELPELEGVTAEMSFPSDITGRVLTETIGILATEGINGTPVECMFVHPSHSSRNSYSKFALLSVQLKNTTAHDGRLDSVEWNSGMNYWNGTLECSANCRVYVKCT